jgi:hypothetical protein
MIKIEFVLLLVALYLSLNAAETTVASNTKPPKGCRFIDGRRQLSCTITKRSDCNNLLNTPYSRNLFCPTAYGAAYTLKKELLTLLGPKAQSVGSFYHFQTLPDAGTVPIGDENQSTDPCMTVPAPWNSTETVSVGLPLCGLLARAASFDVRPNPVAGVYNDKGNPIVSTNRFTKYFKNLVFPTDFTSNVVNFRENSTWDRLVENLGASGAQLFTKLQPDFLNGTAYNPLNLTTPSYYGMSGGGGEGWGSEISVENSILFQFGGGGGAGMTSYIDPISRTLVQSKIGAGGGGGANFGDGYTRSNVTYKGLGLGAGSDYETGRRTYSYYKAGETGNGQLLYNDTLVAAYISEMRILRARLKKECAAGKKIKFQGGGGAGAGAEFLKSNSEQHQPNAVSTQSGFSFSFVIQCSKMGPKAAPYPTGLFAEIGIIYSTANKIAKEKCGGWSNYSCICRTSHAYVIADVKKKYKDVPVWLKASHCPSNTSSPIVPV